MGAYYGYLVAFASGVGGLLFGYEIGVIGQVLSMDSFSSFFGYRYRAADGSYKDCTGDNYPAACSSLAEDTTGWITFTFLIGCVGGALVSSMMADGIGRKFSILFGGVLFTVGGALQSSANGLSLFYPGRVVSGIGVGIMSMSVPLYISETSPTKIRGFLTTIYQLMITIGIFIASVINSIIISTVDNSSATEWRLALGIQIVPGAILFLIMLFMPFSPRWLANRDRDEEAIKTLAHLRNLPVGDAVLKAEFKEIKDSVLAERQIGEASWSELLAPGIGKRVFLGVMLQFFQQWTGINVILYYQSDLFARMGVDKKSADIPFTLANNFINFIATFPGMYLVERAGRRQLLIVGGIIMGVAHCLICLFVGLSSQVAALSWLAIVSVFIFVIGFASSWGPIVWTYQSEIFPMRVRSKGTGVSTMSNWVWNAVIAKITPKIIARINFYNYLVFAAACFIMSAFTYVFVPETMGKSLEEMDEIFGAPSRTRKDAEKTIVAVQ
ncbi:hypothetical protein HK105_206547 [Polyrhizophydium stewartii]|uniref:Major facilitator superfamily (MFS) profile domain-containing protein n=1 Tax=Polyrhizophydium stewartii TaxID=2732419 RepID=A0ABR4N340_9FUNG|nr:hypothetical protein HK105_008295 [Polyrhizophydium stewartii]